MRGARGLLVCLVSGQLACAAPPQVVIGTFTMFNRDAPYLIAAPHGEYDTNTNEIVYEFCARVRWDCLIAEGFRSEVAEINVNRPTEGSSLDETEFTERASLVYAKYVNRIRRLSAQPRFYVEIHGQDYPDLQEFIDVATVGVSRARAEAIDRLLTAGLRDHGLSELRIRIDVLEDVRYRASHARQFGVLSFIRPAIHIELPNSARHRDRARTVEVLVQALPEIAATWETPDQPAVDPPGRSGF